MEERNSIAIKLDKLELALIKAKERGRRNISISTSMGIVAGCIIMFISHKDAIRHYNSCQEQQLLKTIADSRDEKNWYIKEDSKGKLKIVELSKRELDSLSNIK